MSSAVARIYCNLEIEMVALLLNSSLKQLTQHGNNIIVTEIEKTGDDINEKGKRVQKYSLIILSSSKLLSKKEILKEIDNLYQPPKQCVGVKE